MKRCQKNLGEMLLENKAIKPYQLELALQHQKRWGGKHASIMLEMGIVDEKTVHSCLGKQLGWQWTVLQDVQIPPHVLNMMKYEIARKYHIIPIGYDNGILTIATSNPFGCNAIDELCFILGVNYIKTVFAVESAIAHAIERFYLGKTA
jgi:type IV pilus assembly protein PilB